MADKNEAMENLFKAIDIITAERLSNLGYDKTIKATIIDDSQSAQGKYVLTDGSSEFDATCDPSFVYKKDMMVYVIIPEGDWKNDKLIVGKYSNQGDDYYNYANPSEDFLDVTHNLISDVDVASLLANDTSRPYVQLWSCDGVEYQKYNRLVVKGNFRTWLSSLDVMKGTYGLVLYVVSKESQNGGEDYEQTHRFNLFTPDMYGDPFNFETYYLQEKVFDIGGLSNIIHMELLLVQNSDFYDVEDNYVAHKDKDGEKFPDNIFVHQPYVALGYDLNGVITDQVHLYTMNSDTYEATYDEAELQKTMHLRWVHIQEDGVPVAIDLEDEIPSNSVIRWYKYVLNREISDKVAGALWQEIEEARNKFTYSFTPDILLSGERFKVIIESPSREAIAAQLLESEFGDFTGVEIEDKEGQTILDYEVLINALMSYSDNSLLSFQEYKQIIEEYNAKYKVANKTENDYINYSKAIVILDNIQRAQSNVCLYRSETLEFKNKSYDPVAAAIDLISGLTILVDAANYNGSYLLYNDSGMITNAAEATKKRILTATYQSLITGEEVLDKAEKIVWYFPLADSMIYPPQRGTEYTDYEVYSELTDEEIKTLELPCKYCRIERAVPEVLEGDAGDEMMRQTEQVFRIKDYYTQTAVNNTIYCTVFKNGREYQAEASLVFGVSGTCGTDATFLLQMREWDAENARPTDHPVSALTIGKSVAIIPKFYDYNNNDITDEYLKTHTISYGWHSQERNGQGAITLAVGENNPKWAKLTVDSGAGIDKCQYYILSASVNWSIIKYKKDEWGRTVLDELGQPVIDEEQKDIEARDVQLKTFLPIPVRTNDEYTQAVGPVQIIYNKDGTNPTFYDSPFVLYKNGEEFSDVSWMASCREYLESGKDTASRDARILNYYPALDAQGKLTPKNMFLSDGQAFSVEAIVNGEVVWTQPILIIKNKYASAMLNAWDGELCIDQENGTIMSTMVGAGIKDKNNTFTGVLMGDVGAGAGFDERNHSGIGIYGFHQGDQSFGFNVNGTAFIGKAGRGRICMDGNKGTIQSGSYEQYVSGMQIDLDGSDAVSASLRAYGPGGSFELDTDTSGPLFEIRSGPEKDAGKLIHIGNKKNEDFFIQSWDYDKNAKVGTRLDLETGIYETYSDADDSGECSYIRINPKGSSGYFTIHDKSREDDHIFYCSPTTFYLQSVNYTEKEAGMKLDLRNGTIDARKGYIGGWEITKSSIKAGNIELKDEGSMYGGTEGNEWYIKKDGSASFNNLTVTGTGTIGPFKVSSTALTYTGATTFILSTDGLSLNGDAFKVGLDGTTLISGNLTVRGNTTLQGSLSVSGGGGGSGGSGGGSGGGGGGGGRIFSGLGKFYDFGPDNAKIGPWNINEDSISTDYSKLTAEGEIYLGNENGEMKFTTTEAHFTMAKSDLTLSASKFAVDVADGSGIEISKNTLKIHANDSCYIQFYGDGYMAIKSASSRLWLGNTTHASLQYDTAEITVDTDTITLKASDSNKLVMTNDNITIDGKTCSKDRKVTISWVNRTPYFMVYKGLVIDESTTSGDTESEDGGLGELAFLDKVVISSATFKLGSSAISMSQSTDGDTATFTGTIPVSQETYSLRGSRIYGLYTREYNSTTGEYEYSSYSGSAYSSAGSVTVNTVSSTDLTATITVEAVKNEE